MAKVNESEVKKPKKGLVPFSINSLNPTFYLSSGNFALDCVFGNADQDPTKPQGIASGRMLELHGINKSGKSELSQCFIREALALKLHIKYYDQEWSADSKKLGVSEEEWSALGVIYRADTLEEFFAQSKADLEQVMAAQKANKTFGTPLARGIVIVLDSLAAIKSQQEVSKDMGATVVAGSARLNSEEMPKLRRLIGLTHSILIWVNQTRNKVGMSGPGNPETTPGGEAPRFFADYRMRLAFAGSLWIKSGKAAPAKLKPGSKRSPDGFISAGKMIKNKLAPPMREEEFALFFKVPPGERLSGLSNIWTLFYALQGRKKIKSSGGTYTLVGEKFKRLDWPEVFSTHHDKILALYLSAAWSDVPTLDDEDDDED